MSCENKNVDIPLFTHIDHIDIVLVTFRICLFVC